jgi:3-hydroxyisobutyrate dehydrogenase-like beta-hydroxyacid dehydrogenase
MNRIGFIGLGQMGGGIASHLVSRGNRLFVYDPDEAAMARLVKAGATKAASPQDVANRAETVIASLPSSAICREAALGETGILHGTKIRYYLETSTMGRVLAEELAERLGKRDIIMLDAPVSGGAAAGARGELTSIVAGPESAVATLKPVVGLYSTRIFHVGERQGAAQLVKLINNAILLFTTLVTYEGVAVAEQAGVDYSVLVDVLNASSGMSFVSKVILPRVLANPPVPSGKMGIFMKDIDLYRTEVDALGMKAEIAETLAGIAGKASRRPEHDFAPMLREYFRNSVSAYR